MTTKRLSERKIVTPRTFVGSHPKIDLKFTNEVLRMGQFADATVARKKSVSKDTYLKLNVCKKWIRY